MNKLTKLTLLFCLLAAFSFAQQNVITQTSTSAAVISSAQTIPVSSATNISVRSATGNGSILYVVDFGQTQGEAMLVLAVNGTNITVQRGANGTAAVGHASGAMVLVGQPQWFYGYNPTGNCTTASTYVRPWVNVTTGQQWLCSSVTLTWVPGFSNTQAPPQPTAAVASAAGLITPSGPLFHITGTAAITGFTLPVGFNGSQICVVPDAIFTTTAANNIALASTAVVNKTLCWTYDKNSAKFTPSY